MAKFYFVYIPEKIWVHSTFDIHIHATFMPNSGSDVSHKISLLCIKLQRRGELSYIHLDRKHSVFTFSILIPFTFSS